MYKVIPEDVLAEFEYSEKSPTFLIWKNGVYYPHYKNPDFLVCKRKSGDVAGTLTGGYYTVCSKSRYFKVARVIYAILVKDEPSMIIDHIDGDPLNNNIQNLRAIPLEGNSRNRAKQIRKNSDIPSGVSWHKRDRHWIAYYKSPTEFTQSGDARLVQAVFKPEKFSEDLDPVYAAMVAAENWRHTKLNEANIVLEELGRTPYTERHKQSK